MSLYEIRMAYHNSKFENEIAISKIQNLVGVVSKEMERKKEFLHLLNIISTKNKSEWLNSFSSFAGEWNQEYRDIFFTILKSQNLYTDIYVELFIMLRQEDQDDFIRQLFLFDDNTPVESQTVGMFIGKLFQKLPNFKPVDCFDKLPEPSSSSKLSVLAVSAFLSMANDGHKEQIPIELYNSLKHKHLDTQTLMKLYDLDDIMEQN